MEQQEKRFEVNGIQIGVEITLPTPDSFSIIRESLCRIGVKSKKGNVLYQSCHILHRRGKYYITHFLEMFVADGRENNMSDEDYARRNAIAKLLVKWKLCKILNISEVSDASPDTPIDVIPYKEKKDFELVSKYSVGNKKRINHE